MSSAEQDERPLTITLVQRDWLTISQALRQSADALDEMRFMPNLAKAFRALRNKIAQEALDKIGRVGLPIGLLPMSDDARAYLTKVALTGEL